MTTAAEPPRDRAGPDRPAIASDHTHAASNGKRDVTLEELAASQPGMDRLMAELGPRMHRLYYFAEAGNWRAAEYFFRSVVKQLRLCAFARPKYADDLEDYVAEDCQPVQAAIADRDWTAFSTAYQAMVDRANDYHAEWGKPYLVWRTPPTPPQDFELAAGSDPVPR